MRADVVPGAVFPDHDREMHAALDFNSPNYASAIVSASEIVDAL